ncbi:MAG: deaminase, partial [Candidatus Cloacimonadaceae bacterium]|nr:deaminase [Candidatus Cloacimonadaceae bacterium]
SSTKGAELYCTNQPCSICARLIINAEIRTVYVAAKYPDALAEQLFSEAGVDLIHFKIDQGTMVRLV